MTFLKEKLFLPFFSLFQLNIKLGFDCFQFQKKRKKKQKRTIWVFLFEKKLWYLETFFISWLLFEQLKNADESDFSLEKSSAKKFSNL